MPVTSHSPFSGLALTNLLSISMDLPVLDISYKWESSLLKVMPNCTNEGFYGKVNLTKKTDNILFSIVFKKLLRNLQILWSVIFRLDGNCGESENSVVSWNP